MPHRLSRLALAALVVALPACGGGDAEPDTDSLAAESAAAAPAATAPATGADAPLAAADLDAYERALTAEVEVLREAVAKRAAATSQADTIDAMFAAAETQTVAAAAERAGLDASRYRRLDGVFGQVLSARMMNPAMNAMAAELQPADTAYLADLPPARADSMRQQLLSNRAEMQAAFSDSAAYAPIPAALRDSFRQRAEARLDTLWRERFSLRVKAAGIGG